MGSEGGPGTPFYATYSSVGGKGYNAEITADLFRNYPAWSVGRPLPLSIAEAVAIAEGEIGRYDGDKPLWLVSTIEMDRFDTSDNWYFIVSLLKRGKNDPAKIGDDYLTIPVLFTGQPIKGK